MQVYHIQIIGYYTHLERSWAPWKGPRENERGSRASHTPLLDCRGVANDDLQRLAVYGAVLPRCRRG